MFMQAGFAMVESGLTRVKNANHTYMMNFFVYACGLFAYWVLVCHPDGRRRRQREPGGLYPLASEHSISLFGKTWGIFGESGYFLSGHAYDVGRDGDLPLPDGVHGHGAHHRDRGLPPSDGKFITFSVTSVIMGALTYPLFANWAWGGGWLAQLGTNLGLEKGTRLRRFGRRALSRRTHCPGRVLDRGSAPRQVQPRRLGQPDHRT